MQRLQLPKNKLARLAINIAFIPFWYLVCLYISWGIQGLLQIQILSTSFYVFEILHRLFWLITTFLVTRYIWFGRSRRSPKITSSRED